MSKKILFICTAGITSALIVRSLNKRIENENIDITIESSSILDFKNRVEEESFSGVLISPQLKYALPSIVELLLEKDISYKLISDDNYQTLDSSAIMKDVEQLIG